MLDTTSQALQVLIVADPGLPSRRAASIHTTLERYLREAYGVTTTLHTLTDTIRLTPERELALSAVDDLRDDYPDVNIILILTEIPRHTQGDPLIAEVHSERNLAVISCPTLGAWATKRRLIKVMMSSVNKLVPWDPEATTRKFLLGWSNWSNNENSHHQSLHAHTMTGGPRLVLGMTIANEPWRTAPKLSGALAAASATGAFGIFYSSIWQMSTYLSTLRLLSIGAVAILVMVAWLIVSHKLWDRPVSERLATVVMYYNLSTVLTLLITVIALYATLVVFILLGGLVVIDPEFMTQQIQQDSSFANYLDIAWLSAAMGVVAGGIGASFDTDADVQRLTHGQRMRQRVYTDNSTESDHGAGNS
ncbi:hypothetical protein [Brevibacterium aurantiacum]|uniref:5,10-methylene-tetrahydrofolate dehydrogenase n=1 Tax=Brevibacterium aurantiacum TaxID=273384 RepID=A0A1D7VZF7_BREAU|nr:hypothetical protein [Brevibacterium aurantiacum]AOP52229.1 hypothetical protein BLSMQ_0515 [Brevibacterium aurantiacum]